MSETELFTAKPTEDRKAWMVYDMYRWPPAPIFIGTMEDAGAVADMKNKQVGWGVPKLLVGGPVAS